MEAISGLVIVLTGAGAGIGQALAQGLVREGAHVIAVSRSMAGLEKTKELCSGPGSIECHEINVSDFSALDSLYAATIRKHQRIDIVINNAAIYPHVSVRNTTTEIWENGLATNINGVVYSCMAAIRNMPKDRPALILNVGTFAYLGPLPDSSIYCTTKAAVAAFTLACSVDLATEGSQIVVNEWKPGEYKTQMSGFTGANPEVAFDHLKTVISKSWQGKGGRAFVFGDEVLPPRSKLSRLKALILGQRK